MKIRTRVKIAGALAICVVLVYGAWSLYVNQTMRQMSLEVKEANQIIDRIFWLRALTYDFLSIPTERAQRQWSAVYEDLRRLLESPAFLKLQEAYGTADTPDKLINLGETFSKLLEIQKNQGHDNPAGETQRELQRRLTTQLLLAAQDLATRIFKMTERINDELLATQQLESSLDNLALLALGLIIISIALVFKRSVVTPVLQLHDGVEIIGAGNLDYKVGLPTKDEIGELSQAFDRMTANLQMVTVSRDDLVREMAERQRAEAALRESREDLNRAQAVAHTGSWRMNVQKNQLTWSDENHRIFGIPPGTPMTYENFLGIVHPEDRESVDRKWMAALRGEPYDIEHRIMVDNMVKWVRERAGLEFDSEGELIGGFGTTQDITERKRAEKALRESETKFRSLFESMNEGVVLHEMIYDESGRAVDYRILTTNSAFEKHTGLKTAQLQGQLASEVYGTGAAPYLETYARVASSCQPASFETFFPPLQRYFHISATAPKPGHFVTVFEDITERKQIEAALRERTAELSRAVADLEEKNAELERFTYMISHDLKSPLVTISTFLGYLEKDMESGDTGRIAKDMQHMRTAANKMGQLLGELLEMSRIGRVVNPPVEFSFQDLVQEVLHAVAGPIAARGVEVQVSARDVTLFGDRPRLVEIWQNLVENAVKFMGEHAAPRLEIGLERQGLDTVFFVCDNGIGIDPHYQGKIFGIFEKLDARSEGTGIGLALIKRIVELYEGTIWVESAGEGQGACFRFTLPGAVKSSELAAISE